jgi:hypothetical protein
MLFALTESWSDGVAITGLIATVAGFAITLYQLRKTKSAAEAARAAAEQAFAEGRRHLHTVVTTSTHRFVNELREMVERDQWDPAGRRANDLANQLALLPTADTEVAGFIDELRPWGQLFARLASGERKRRYNDRWAAFLVRIQRKLDSLQPAIPGTGDEQ